MKAFVLGVIAITLLFLASCAGGSAHNVVLAHQGNSSPASKKTMAAFASEQELRSYLRKIAEKQRQQQRQHIFSNQIASSLEMKSDSAAAAPAPTQAAAGGSNESVTNNQHAGVDEGGIVKVHGNYLVVLRRGRLFTVTIGDGRLEPISSIDAFAPDIDPGYTWYDEMLVYNDTIVVIGYSYQRGGTEVNLFGIDPAGKLSYRSTYHLRSNDYYSSRNYASRLIGSKLIFYSPFYFYPSDDDVSGHLPAVRKWHKNATESEFQPIVSANRVYRPNGEFQLGAGLVLHTVTTCDLKNGGFDCQATSVMGPPGRVFYVSPESVYVWLSDWMPQGRITRAQSMLYRLPLDGSGPSALAVSGSPLDQFSFLESGDHLNVVVRSSAYGEGMWGSEVASGSVALMRIPLASFSDGSASVPSAEYRALPTPRGNTFQNRFVGDYLLYGTGSGWGYPEAAKYSTLYAVPWAGGDIQRLHLAHGTDRIEAMGQDAVVVGTDGTNLHFTAVRLGDSPEAMDDFVQSGASQGELRSHGFFYKPDTDESGILGLPIREPAQPGYSHLFQESAAVLFLRNESLHFEKVGELAAEPEGAKDDACRASCVDWYGNSRPLFVRGRVIALLGYELVEGRLESGRIREVRRISYAPEKLTASRKQNPN
jgi:Beta propeller domain